MVANAPHRPRKRFGQNFLHDNTVIERIIEAFDPDPAFAVVEIGPGKGALTIPLLRKAAAVNVIEIDTDLARLLEQKCARYGHLQIHVADALKFDYSKIQPAPLQVIGNLPYNISTPLLFHLLEHITSISFMLLMLQKEVVDRICASENEHDYGRLSVMVQSQCQVEKLFSVPAQAFKPVPKVTSALVKLSAQTAPLTRIEKPALFEQIVRHAFSQRRKTLRNALRELVELSCFEALAISPAKRAENLSVKNYIDIANYVYHQQNQ
jgi:16S rRNA (adenine1518-N6/adenine1519-N6)-dimethyltransferase